MHRKAAYELAIGFALRTLQSERNIPRERVAEALEVEELAVTRIETGEEPMTAGDLILMLELFEISWDEFLERVNANLPAAERAIMEI